MSEPIAPSAAARKRAHPLPEAEGLDAIGPPSGEGHADHRSVVAVLKATLAGEAGQGFGVACSPGPLLIG